MEEEKKKGGGKKWFFGCCGGLIVLALLCVAGGYFGAGYLKNQMATGISELVTEQLENAELSPEQTEGIKVQTRRLETAIKSWGTVEAIERMGNLESMQQEIGEMTYHIILVTYSSFVLPNTELTEEERAEGRLTIQRYARGIDEGKLSLNENDDSWQLNAKQSDDEDVAFNPEEVRAHLADLAKKADNAGIPNEPYEVDLANKLKEIVDALIGDE